MAQDTEERLLQALQGLAHDLHKPAPTQVIRKPNRTSPNKILVDNLDPLTGMLVVNDDKISVVAGVATAVLTHFGAKGTNISPVSRGGACDVTKADWLNDIA